MIVLIIVLTILQLPSVKGYFGERSISIKLKKLDPQKYIVLNDVMIPSVKGKTTQIDHVVVSLYGIFVIETKNYRGWIYGNEHSEYWTQVIYKRKEKLYNPVRQNYGHVKALEQILSDYSHVPFHSIISFSVRADLKKIEVNSAAVVYSVNLLKTIRKQTNEFTNYEGMKRIAEVIQASNNTEKSARKEHVKSLKTNQTRKANANTNDICPKCSGQLVARTGKYGSFKGCSNYPNCRFILR
ncbi:NERD domain-containing protein [Paenibacillus sp. M.A.Huq-84]